MRVALLGFGLAGRWFHRPLLAANPDFEVVTVVTSDPVRQRLARTELPGASLLGSADELWPLAANYDLAVVATPTWTHVPLATKALAVGLPVVVDKPIATDAASARTLAAASKKAGLALVPFHNRRWDADHLTLQSLIEQGELGDILRYEARFERWRPTANRSSWREARASEEGGGLLLDLGTHLIDQALALFGPVGAVYAELDARRAVAEDDVFVALHHDAGVHSHLWAGSMAAAPGPRLRVLGSRAAFIHDTIDGQEADLRAGADPAAPEFGSERPEHWGRLLGGENGDSQEPVRSLQGRWTAFYAGVAATLSDDAPPPVSVDEAVAGLEVLDAARISAAEGRVVRLP